MFADLELIGIPHRITIGERSLKQGQVEYQARREGKQQMVDASTVLDFAKGLFEMTRRALQAASALAILLPALRVGRRPTLRTVGRERAGIDAFCRGGSCQPASGHSTQPMRASRGWRTCRCD